jgi:hypothetical protein
VCVVCVLCVRMCGCESNQAIPRGVLSTDMNAQDDAKL